VTQGATCPECRAHFNASDELSACALRDEHVRLEHGLKCDEKTLAYIADLESKNEALNLEIEALKAPKRKEKKR
jgi:hypothetical protein